MLIGKSLSVSFSISSFVLTCPLRVAPAISNNYAKAGVVVNFVTATGGDVEMLRSIECFYKWVRFQDHTSVLLMTLHHPLRIKCVSLKPWSERYHFLTAPFSPKFLSASVTFFNHIFPHVSLVSVTRITHCCLALGTHWTYPVIILCHMSPSTSIRCVINR